MAILIANYDKIQLTGGDRHADTPITTATAAATDVQLATIDPPITYDPYPDTDHMNTIATAILSVGYCHYLIKFHRLSNFAAIATNLMLQTWTTFEATPLLVVEASVVDIIIKPQSVSEKSLGWMWPSQMAVKRIIRVKAALLGYSIRLAIATTTVSDDVQLKATNFQRY